MLWLIIQITQMFLFFFSSWCTVFKHHCIYVLSWNLRMEVRYFFTFNRIGYSAKRGRCFMVQKLYLHWDICMKNALYIETWRLELFFNLLQFFQVFVVDFYIIFLFISYWIMNNLSNFFSLRLIFWFLWYYTFFDSLGNYVQ